MANHNETLLIKVVFGTDWTLGSPFTDMVWMFVFLHLDCARYMDVVLKKK